MVNHGAKQHQNLIAETVLELREKGYHAININGTAPDAIAIKDNKIYAVEILLITHIPKKGWKHLTVVKNKRERYSMFDDVIFKVEGMKMKVIPNKLRKELKIQKQANKIVEEFINENCLEIS